MAGHLLISLETLRHSDGQPTDHAVLLFGHSEYYPRFGFRPAREFGMLPAWDAAMVYPLQDDLSEFRGLYLPE